MTPTISTMPCGVPSARSAGSLRSGGTKPRLTSDDAAAGKPRRREDPVAWSLHIRTQRRAGGVNKRLLAVEEFGRESRRGEILRLLLELRPARTRRQILRRMRQPRVQSSRSDFLSRPCGRAARRRGQTGWRCRQARTPSPQARRRGACAALCSHFAPAFETAFRRLVMVLQRDQQALDQPQRRKRHDQDQRQPQQPHAASTAADRPLR